MNDAVSIVNVVRFVPLTVPLFSTYVIWYSVAVHFAYRIVSLLSLSQICALVPFALYYFVPLPPVSVK